MNNSIVKRKMLITGISGLLGNNLGFYFKDKFDVLGLYNANVVNINGIQTVNCDITDLRKISELISSYAPDIIVHCASLTNIDACEVQKELTEQVNQIGTRNIVKNIIHKDAKLIYISTDSVYEGTKGDYVEDDAARPQNYYGLSKYMGELEVESHKNNLVLRTNLFGWNIQDKESLGEWILNSLLSRKPINCFTDVYFSSIYTMELIRVIDIAFENELNGLFNCGSSDSCTKYEFALNIADKFSLDNSLINPISIGQAGFKAHRGKNLSLNVNKLQDALNYKLPSIDYSIEAFYRDYKCKITSTLGNICIPQVVEAKDLTPYGRQSIDDSDIKAVVDVLKSRKITQGPNVEYFEADLSNYCKSNYAVAVNSGTSALHIACLAAEIKKGDEVITSTNTFVASSNCVVYCHGTPVFADIDYQTYNISPLEIEKKINKRTKAVIPVHFAGQSCNMQQIRQIVKNAEKKYGHKIYIIEDASHALGSEYADMRVGSCAFSDMATMSFHPVKHITTGEGGAVLTNNKELFKRLKLYRSHGITNSPGVFEFIDEAFGSSTRSNQKTMNPWYYEQQKLGFNYRMTNIQATLGCSQLKRLSRFVVRRKEIVTRYNQEFKQHENIQIPFESKKCNSNFHLYVLLIDFESLKKNRAELIEALRLKGIQTQVHYIPVHTQPFYQQNYQTKWGDCPNAERYYRKCLSIPLFPAMTDEEIAKTIDALKSLIS